MDYNTLLQEYFDGELDEQRESALFRVLSHDTALRQEFNTYVAMQSAAQADAAQTVLPASATASVFGALGYAISGGSVSTGAVTTWQRLRSYAPYVLVSVVSSLLTALIFFLLFPWHENQTTPVAQSAKAVANATATRADGIPHTEKTPVEGSRSAAVFPSRTAQSAAVLAAHVPLVVSSFEEQREEAAEGSMPIEPVQPVRAEQHIAVQAVSSNMEILEISPSVLPSAFSLPSVGLSSVDIAARSILASSYPSVDIPTQTSSSFTNVALSAWYQLSQEHAIGIECGREAFGQEFRQRVGTSMATVRQNPTLWWLGASYRLSLADMQWSDWHPYAQAVLGGTEVGALGKVVLGAQFAPSRNIALLVGVEGSMLAYPVEGVYYTANKLGVTYGIRVQF